MEFFLQGTREALEFDKILSLINPCSCYGKVHKKSLIPYLPGYEKVLREELAKVRESSRRISGTKPEDWQRIQHLLAQVPDISEEVSLLKNGLVLHEINFFNIKKFLYLVHGLAQLWKETKLFPEEYCQALMPPGKLNQEYLQKNTGYQFYLGDYGGEDYLRVQKEIKELSARLAQAEKDGMKKLKQDLAWEDKLFTGKYIYVSSNDREKLAQALEHPLLEKHRDFGGEICFARKITPLEEELEKSLQVKKQEEEALDLEIRKKLSELLKGYAGYFDHAQKELGYADWLLAKAVFMGNFNCIVPQIQAGTAICLEQGVNLNIRNDLAKVQKVFSPVSLDFREKNIVITGANMGGKTVTLKTLGLLVAMAQHGIPVPAASFSFPLYRFLFLAGESREKTGLSSFAAEIERLKTLLGRIHEKGLLLLDEPARSTNPQEGLAIVGAFLKRMAGGQATSIVVTHFEGLAPMVRAEHWQVKGIKSVESLLHQEDLEKYFDYSLEKVETDKQVPRDAIKVAELLGLEKEVLEEAKILFQEIMKGGKK